MGYEGNTKYSFVLSNVLGAKKPTIGCHEITPGKKNEAAEVLKDKRFVVKIQVPMPCKYRFNTINSIDEKNQVFLLKIKHGIDVFTNFQLQSYFTAHNEVARYYEIWSMSGQYSSYWNAFL